LLRTISAALELFM